MRPPLTAISATTASSVSASSSFVLSTSTSSLLPFTVPDSSTSSPRRAETEVGVSGRVFRESTADWLQEEAARQRGRGGVKGRLSLRRRGRRNTLLEGESEGEEEGRRKEMGAEGAQKERGGETGARVVEDDEEEGDPFGRGRQRLTSGSARASTYARSSFSSRGGRFLASPESRPKSNSGGSGMITSLAPAENASAGEKEVVDWEAAATPVPPARRRADAAEGDDEHLSTVLVGPGVVQVVLGAGVGFGVGWRLVNGERGAVVFTASPSLENVVGSPH